MTAIGATALLLLVIGGVAVAAAPGSNNVIKGCYAAKGGALKVVSSTAHCPKGYRFLSWNVKGRTGATGKTGATGRTGPRGQVGPKGEPGPQGPGALRLMFRSDSMDSGSTLLAASSGIEFYGRCFYDSSIGKATVALYLQTQAGTLFDLTGYAIAIERSTNAVILQSVVGRYAVGGTGERLLVTAPSTSTSPHVVVAWGPIALTARAGDGSVKSFSVAATVSSDARASGVNANEGRCRIDGSVTPTS